MKKLLASLTALTLWIFGGACCIDAAIFGDFSTRIQSKYFVFYSKIPRHRLQRYAEFSDLFLDVVNRDFIRLRRRKRMDAAVLSSRSGMQRFLAEKLQRNEPPLFGIFIAERNLFVTYDGAGLGTFSHEIMHPIVDTELPHTPWWAREGIPAFFEKFYGYKEGNRLYLKWGYQNPWRIRGLEKRLLRLKLTDIVQSSSSQSEQRLVSVFLYQRGKWKRFLDLIRRGDKNGYRTYIGAAFGRGLPELERKWRKYLKETYSKRDQIYRLPLSTYFESRQEFLDFARQIGLDLR